MDSYLIVGIGGYKMDPISHQPYNIFIGQSVLRRIVPQVKVDLQLDSNSIFEVLTLTTTDIRNLEKFGTFRKL